jgi:hypothetical protein
MSVITGPFFTPLQSPFPPKCSRHGEKSRPPSPSWGFPPLARPGTPAGPNLLNGLQQGQLRPQSLWCHPLPVWESPRQAQIHTHFFVYLYDLPSPQCELTSFSFTPELHLHLHPPTARHSARAEVGAEVDRRHQLASRAIIKAIAFAACWLTSSNFYNTYPRSPSITSNIL